MHLAMLIPSKANEVKLFNQTLPATSKPRAPECSSTVACRPPAPNQYPSELACMGHRMMVRGAAIQPQLRLRPCGKIQSPVMPSAAARTRRASSLAIVVDVASSSYIIRQCRCGVHGLWKKRGYLVTQFVDVALIYLGRDVGAYTFCDKYDSGLYA